MDLFTMVFGALRVGGLLGALLVVFAAIVIWRGMKSRTALVLMIGGILAALGPLGSFVSFWILARYLGVEQAAIASLVAGSVGALGWLLVGGGGVMLAPKVVGLARRNRELEAIVAGRE